MGLTACAFMTNPLFAAPRGRPVIKDGTIKTDDGQILRGMSLHISKSYSSRNLTWGLNINNLIDVREKLHMNCIRLNCLDPRAVHDGRPTSAFATIAEEAYYADSVIANAGAVGLYICLDYHCMGEVYDGSTWDIRNFWDFYAPRYKDKTWVMYEIENEPYQGAPPGGTANDWPTNNEVDLYKNHVRRWAPNTMILTGMEPVNLTDNWGPYLKNVYAPACGFTWDSGKDAWPWHPYGGTTSTAIKATWATGVPMICTESSYWEEGDNNAIIDGYHYPAEWCERNHMSWFDWHRWDAADQLHTPLTYLIPDATSKGWAWWTSSTISRPHQTAPARDLDFVLHTANMVQANGRLVKGQAQRDNGKYSIFLWPNNPNLKQKK